MFHLHSAGCEEDEFQCPPDGPCYPIWYLCDNITNCFDGFDEDPDICNITGELNCIIIRNAVLLLYQVLCELVLFVS